MAKRPGRTADSGSRGGEGFGAARRGTAGRSTAKAASRPDTSGTYVSVPGSRKAPSKAAQRLRDADPNAPVEVTITLRGPKLPDASNLAQPAMTPDEFRKRYAASPEDANEVARVLQRFGLKVEELSLETRSMRVKGPVAAIEAAFQPKLAVYKNEDQGQFRDRDQDYKIPVELKGTVTSILGLSERRVARRRCSAPGLRNAAARAVRPLSPADLETRYSFPPGDGNGQTIAIAQFGGGFFADDLAAYCRKHGRPVPAVTTVPVNLAPLTLQQIRRLPPPRRRREMDLSAEVMMDVEIVAGLCPKAAIQIYFAPFNQKGWVDLLNEVIKARPVTLSVSWGQAEDDPNWSPAAVAAINERLNMVALLGITACVAAGDDGSGDQLTDGRAHVDFPSSSPFVLSVGGTMRNETGGEKVWWRWPGREGGGGGATGGGVSVMFDRPEWQNIRITSLNRGSIDGRVVPDVAALAGLPLYDVVFRGEHRGDGGTSASTPLWAALVARIDARLPAARRQRFLTPFLYQRGPNGRPRGQAGCRDITKGHNASYPEPGRGYEARPGYDAVSGWGTPIGTALLAALSQPVTSGRDFAVQTLRNWTPGKLGGGKSRNRPRSAERPASSWRRRAQPRD